MDEQQRPGGWWPAGDAWLARRMDLDMADVIQFKDGGTEYRLSECWPVVNPDNWVRVVRWADGTTPAPASLPEQPQPDDEVRPCGCGRPLWSEEAEEEFDAAGEEHDPNHWCPHWCIEDVPHNEVKRGDWFAIQGDIPLALVWHEATCDADPETGAFTHRDVYRTGDGSLSTPFNPTQPCRVLRIAMIGRQTYDPAAALPVRERPDREALGRLVREVWVAWAQEQTDPKPTWLVGWDDLPEPDKEVDRRIGEALADAGRALPVRERGADGSDLIAAERQRQIDAEGWTPEHDDHHTDGSIAMAGAAYALLATSAFQEIDGDAPYGLWPWHVSWWKPSDDPVRNLVRAGALIAAEIDRVLAAADPGTGAS